MEDNRVTSLGFLHKTFPDVNQVALEYWIRNQEFADVLLPLVEKGIHIDARTVFEVMRKIYFGKEKLWEETDDKPDFNFHLARRGIKSLWKSMTGSTEGWRGE